MNRGLQAFRRQQDFFCIFCVQNFYALKKTLLFTAAYFILPALFGSMANFCEQPIISNYKEKTE